MKPTQSISESLAQSLVAAWSVTDEFPVSLNQATMRAIPLLELLEVARAANSSACRHSADKDGATCETCVALAKLKEKVPDL